MHLLSSENIDKKSLYQKFEDKELHYNEGQIRFKEDLIEPLVNYVNDQLNDTNYILHILEKYKKRTEWFLRENLMRKYNDADSSYERIFDDDLRLYLFDQGVENAFSTPKSASGRADIVGQLEGDDPLILEVKIYDSKKDYKKNKIVEGFTQIVKYATDFNKNVGYLVVFNTEQIEIKIEPTNSDNIFPPKIIFSDKVYYIIIVNLNFDKYASEIKKLHVVSITQQELTKDLEE